MSDFKPSFPYNTPMHFLTAKEEKILGVVKKSYAEPTEENIFLGSFKTYGGTETEKNGIYSIIDTAVIETWYTPEITAKCRIVLAQQPGKAYEIIGEPENINMRNQFLKFKVQRVTGGV